jgi:hypothetical protein
VDLNGDGPFNDLNDANMQTEKGRFFIINGCLSFRV